MICNRSRSDRLWLITSGLLVIYAFGLLSSAERDYEDTPGTGSLDKPENGLWSKEIENFKRPHGKAFLYELTKRFLKPEQKRTDKLTEERSTEEDKNVGFEKINSDNATDEESELKEEGNNEHFPSVQFPFGNPGRLIFPAIITLYLFLCLTIVCDCFLVPTIQAISIAMDLSLDVAGATLMAAASSSPEFFINVLATFLTKSDVGVGTVLGSGLYALLIVPGLCILMSANKVLRVDYWPITRDSLAYLASIGLLAMTLADGKVFWYEAASFLAVYCIYLIVLHFNSEIRYYIEMIVVIIRRRRYRHLDDAVWPLLQKPGRPPISMSVEDVFYVLEDHTPEFYTMGEWPSEYGVTTKMQWLLMWPIINTMRLTIPTFYDGRLYVITFAMCVVWIGVLCYSIAWMITIIGAVISVPDSVMGLTLLAAGMSIPETISGIVVAKQGYGTMALSNALGSNTFSILMGLGVPWLIKTVFFINSESLTNSFLVMNSKGMEYSTCVVLAALLLVFGTFVVNGFRLKIKSGWFLLFSYLVFIGIAIYNELRHFWKSM